MQALQVEAKIRDMKRNGLQLRHPIAGDSLEDKKKALKESLEDKKMINKLLKFDCRKEPVKVSAPPEVTPAQLKKEALRDADEARKVMLAREQNQQAKFGMKPEVL